MKKTLALLTFILIFASCSNNTEQIVGKWENRDISPPPSTITIKVDNNDNISVNHQWRLEYHDNVNGGSWLNTGKGSKFYNHASYDEKSHSMLVDGHQMVFSKNFSTLKWKGHTYYKVKN